MGGGGARCGRPRRPFRLRDRPATDVLTCRDGRAPADEPKQGNCVSKASVSYSPTMSRWDPEPTSFQRWTVRHSKKIRMGAALFMLLGICWMVFGLLTRAFVGLLNGWMPVVSFSGLILLASVNISQHVEKYDAQHRTPHSV
jgi:hypothetical protein